MKTIYVNNLTKNLIVENQTFLISYLENSNDKYGKEYIKLILGDKTGKIEAKIWNDALQSIPKDILKVGKLISVTGKVEDFKGLLQVNIKDVKEVDEKFLEEFLESSMFPLEVMLKMFENRISQITNHKIKEVIQKILKHPSIVGKFEYWPAASSVHHSFRSGLLQHILEMFELMDGLKKYYPDVNYDILSAGIILHDIGKLEELSGGIENSYTLKGSLIGHITLGAIIFNEVAKNILDEETYLHILHLILSHHGSLEFGSPVLPMTLEAHILSRLDDLSSKLRIAHSFVQKIPKGEYFSEYCKWLNNTKLWNGKTNTNSEDSFERLSSDSILSNNNNLSKDKNNNNFDDSSLSLF